MRNRHRFTAPPRAVGRPGVALDNFSVVSGNLLSEIAIWQSLTDRQPRGTAVMVLPAPNSPLRRVYGALARVLRAQGKTVKLYSAGG